ncbi:hypothetical protein SAMN05444158_1413 [Bradyrhizobium canariense]|uniref:Uncharacterized protein n=1 Tax=Bradyrhizobium canariense TaxID=255045 RepID=A0A1H1QI01_9BRAD|nr:hypothetical protein SAMN05444158_1413 [Bradyrhizobium canariense]
MGPEPPGHQPSLDGLLPVFGRNTKPSAVSFYAERIHARLSAQTSSPAAKTGALTIRGRASRTIAALQSLPAAPPALGLRLQRPCSAMAGSSSSPIWRKVRWMPRALSWNRCAPMPRNASSWMLPAKPARSPDLMAASMGSARSEARRSRMIRCVQNGSARSRSGVMRHRMRSLARRYSCWTTRRRASSPGISSTWMAALPRPDICLSGRSGQGLADPRAMAKQQDLATSLCNLYGYKYSIFGYKSM